MTDQDIKKGLAGVVVDTTKVSKVVQETNSLTYRGYPVQELAATSFTVAGADPGLVAAYLSAEHGIGVRAGKFCAHLLVDELLADVEQTSAVRISAGLGTTVEHVDRMLTALRSL